MRPRVVLVHGSVTNSALTWGAQAPLGARYDIVALDRPGFPPNAPVERVDFEEHAEWVAERLEPGDHLVAHSYGGVVSLLAAGLRPDALRSLTVIEPPAFSVARGVPAVDEFVAAAEHHWAEGPRDPESFLRAFLELVGSRPPPSPLPPPLEQGARTLMVERLPSEADIPLAGLRAAPFAKLVVSGGHKPAFETVCDVLERELHAERVVLAGAGHAIPRLGDPFNRVLSEFVDRNSEAGVSSG